MLGVTAAGGPNDGIEVNGEEEAGALSPTTVGIFVEEGEVSPGVRSASGAIEGCSGVSTLSGSTAGATVGSMSRDGIAAGAPPVGVEVAGADPPKLSASPPDEDSVSSPVADGLDAEFPKFKASPPADETVPSFPLAGLAGASKLMAIPPAAESVVEPAPASAGTPSPSRSTAAPPSADPVAGTAAFPADVSERSRARPPLADEATGAGLAAGPS